MDVLLGFGLTGYILLYASTLFRVSMETLSQWNVSSQDVDIILKVHISLFPPNYCFDLRPKTTTLKPSTGSSETILSGRKLLLRNSTSRSYLLTSMNLLSSTQCTIYGFEMKIEEEMA